MTTDTGMLAAVFRAAQEGALEPERATLFEKMSEP